MQIKKQQFELDMKQRTGSKSGKGYVKILYGHPAYLTYVQTVRVCVCVITLSLSHVRFFVTPWTVAHQAPLSMEFSGQGY